MDDFENDYDSSDHAAFYKRMVRSALGRTAHIGDLYDARTETFTSKSFFSSPLPQKFISSGQAPGFAYTDTHNDRLFDRFEFFQVEPDLQLSILLGQLSLSGHGKYLTEETSFRKTVTCSRHIIISTFCEQLSAAFPELVEFIDKNVFEDDRYTHVVVQKNWGANFTFTLEKYASELSKKMEVEGMPKEEIEKVALYLGLKICGRENWNNLEKEAVNNINLKFYADLDGMIPNSAEKAIELINKIPELLKSVNNGKGIPMNYTMIPLDDFKQVCGLDKRNRKMLNEIDVGFIVTLVYFFEDLAVVKQKLNDLKNDLANFEKYSPQDCLSKIQQKEEEIKTYETKLKTDLAEDLPEVRAGAIPMRYLIEKLERHKSSGLNIVKIKDFIKEFEPEFEEKNQGLFWESLNFFLAKAKKSARENSRCIILDFDINKKIPCEISDVKIVLFKGGRVVTHDVYKEHETERAMNLANLRNPTNIEYVKYKPENRIDLTLACPGSRNRSCPGNLITWKCKICKNNLEYGFDNYFYCACGKAKSHLYEFRCSSFRHGDEFLSFTRKFPIQKELPTEVRKQLLNYDKLFF